MSARSSPFCPRALPVPRSRSRSQRTRARAGTTPTSAAADRALDPSGDADGSRVLVISSPQRGLQVFTFTDGVIPDDPHVQELFPAPLELASIPKIVYAEGAVHTALPGAEVYRDARNETVLSACLLDPRMWGDHGPAVAVA